MYLRTNHTFVRELKSIKKRRFIWSLILLIPLLFIGLVGLLQFSSFQSIVLNVILNRVNASSGTNISVESIDVDWSGRLRASGLLILDHKSDTLAYADQLYAEWDEYDLGRRYFGLDKVVIDELTANLLLHTQDTTWNINILLAQLSSEDTSSGKPIVLEIENIRLGTLRFKRFDLNIPDTTSGFDASHLVIDEAMVRASGFVLNSKGFSISLDTLQARDHKNFEISNLSTQAKSTDDGITLSGSNLQTPASNIDFDLAFVFDKSSDFGSFLDSVGLNIAIDTSILSSSDLAYFVPVLSGLRELWEVNAQSRGPIRHYTIDELVLLNRQGLYLQAAGNLNNTATDTFSYRAAIKNLVVDPNGLGRIPLYPFNDTSELRIPTSILKTGVVSSSGLLSGTTEKMHINVSLVSDFDEVNFIGDAVFGHQPFELKGEGDINSVHLERIEEVDFLSELNTDVRLQIFNGKEAYIKLEGHTEHVTLGTTTVHNLEYQVENEGGEWAFALKVDERNARLEARAEMLLNEALNYEAMVDIAHIHPWGLGGLGMDSGLVVEGIILSKGGMQDEKGQFSVLSNKTTLRRGENQFQQDGWQGNLSYTKNDLDLTFRAPVLEFQASMHQDDNVSLATVLESVVKPWVPWEQTSSQIAFTGDLKESGDLTQVLLPGLDLGKNVHLEGKLDGVEKDLSLVVEGDKAYVNGAGLNDYSIHGLGKDSIVELRLKSNTLNITDSLYFQDVELNSGFLLDSFYLTLDLLNSGKEVDNSLHAKMVGTVSDEHLDAKFENTYLKVADSAWTVEHKGLISVDSGIVEITGLEALSGSKKVGIEGKIGPKEDDILRVTMDRLNLDNVSKVVALDGAKARGMLSGYILSSAILTQPTLSGKLHLEDISFNDEDFGEGVFAVEYLGPERGLHTSGRMIQNGLPLIWFNGTYNASKKENSLNVKGLVQNLKLKSLEPFLKDYLSDMGGEMKGELFLRGTPAKPLIYSDLFFHEANFTVNYLGTHYNIDNQRFKIRDDWFGFDYIELSDRDGNKAHATATIFHDNYHDLNFDINVDAENFEMLHTTANDNELYYGVGNVTGNMNISGYADQLLIDADVKAERGSRFFFPLEEGHEVSKSDFIVYVSDDTSTTSEEDYKADLEGIQLNMNLEIDNGTEIQLIFDELAGDIMKTRGDGNLRMEMNTLGEFSMFGDYNVNEGSYLFTLENIVNKKFQIEPGSKITWTGDPLHAKLDMVASYGVRAKLEELLGDETLTRRSNTKVLLNMKDDLLAPDINFTIDFPGMEESLKSRALSVLNTEDARNKQAFSLLLLNSFTPPEGGMQTDNNIAGATSYDLLANQLSNWLSYLSKKVQIGVSELNSESFEVALSKGFFDDRVTIEGNVGVTGEDGGSDQQGNSRFVGDFELEYKIIRNGKLTAKVFNRSNDQALINAQNARDTQGIGIFFRQDFDRFGDLFRRKNKEK